ncbi:hypothetical protein KOR42_17360 [Thalassoglobus neptunius]|uniref:Thiol reductase thioredoxin n=1 Tax=Thalassoglobus neptunius TaxID=1938619 RepID=A0A5C5X917_9PLAN|nr:thioredoxin family protein [Thalassoglobus neptunius]TWT58362.1 hypothetical protein KOR42_17360 [Thalassoglobus neptunius]
MDYNQFFEEALPYSQFLERYATPDQNHRWSEFRKSVKLTAAQVELLKSFTREMKVLVMAGAWCGDCVNQCPIFDRFTEVNPKIRVHFADRDDTPDLSENLKTCGGARVPALVFLSEDGHFCGRAGDRTLSKCRSVVASQAGAACPTGIVSGDGLTAAVVQDWLDEFERIQWMLRTSTRLRNLHGD